MMNVAVLGVVVPDADKIRSTADEVVQRPEFQLRPQFDQKPLWDILWRILKPFFEFIYGLWEISPVLAWAVIIGLVLLLILIVTHIISAFRSAIGRRISLAAEIKLEARKTDPAELERQSEDAAARSDYITAVRLLFRAALLRIAKREQRELRPGTTNREYLRRYSQSPFSAGLRNFVDVIDAKWYGGGVCELEDYQSCRRAHREICELAVNQ